MSFCGLVTKDTYWAFLNGIKLFTPFFLLFAGFKAATAPLEHMKLISRKPANKRNGQVTIMWIYISFFFLHSKVYIFQFCETDHLKEHGQILTDTSVQNPVEVGAGLK